MIAPPAARRARWRQSVAPASADLGVMLPYSPLHHLLLADVGAPLVMTSGNVSDEPIAYDDEDALRAAGRDRRPVPAPRPADPDAHRRLGGARRPARRGRCCCAARAATCPRASTCRWPARAAARLRRRAEEHLLRSPRARRAWVGHHIGDLENYETLRSFTRGHRALPAAVRRRARGGGARPPPRVPVHQVRDGARRRAA